MSFLSIPSVTFPMNTLKHHKSQIIFFLGCSYSQIRLPMRRKWPVVTLWPLLLLIGIIRACDQSSAIHRTKNFGNMVSLMCMGTRTCKTLKDFPAAVPRSLLPPINAAGSISLPGQHSKIVLSILTLLGLWWGSEKSEDRLQSALQFLQKSALWQSSGLEGKLQGSAHYDPGSSI